MRARTPIALVLAMVACGSKEPREPPRPACRPAPPAVTGTATYYDADGTGKCSFAAAPDRMVAAIGRTQYAGAAACGACLAVTGPGGAEVVVRVVDGCPGCEPGDLDLSREAFARLAPLRRGRIPITWRRVACEVSGPIAYRFKERSNAFWTGVQLRNHRYPIASLEVRARDGAGYRPVRRAAYNYFVGERLGPGPYAFRITGVRGQVLEDEGIALGAGVVRTGAAQFPICQ